MAVPRQQEQRAPAIMGIHVQGLWTPRHAACGRGATRFAAALLLVLLTLTARAPAADSFVRRLAERALERGIAQEARGDIAQALTSYDEAVRTDTTLGAAALRLGSLRERLGDRSEAELLYGHAIAAPETSADAYYARALLRSASHQRAAATLDLAESVARAPRPERLRLLGGWYVEARTWPAALAVWRALQASAALAGDAASEREARLTITALAWLAGDTDPVLAGASSPDWVRRSLARAARRARGEPQGARKLTP
jgi:tetratricopeptide (TPR) repeat protein